LGTTFANQNSIQEEIKSRLQSGNACYHLVQKEEIKSRLQSGNACYHLVQNVLCSNVAVQKYKD